jgi:hypothetical protein
MRQLGSSCVLLLKLRVHCAVQVQLLLSSSGTLGWMDEAILHNVTGVTGLAVTTSHPDTAVVFDQLV